MTEPLDTLRRLNAQFISNFVHNDVVAHDALIHPRFAYISGSGARIGRATYLKNWAAGFDSAILPYWDTRDEQISVFGNVALVSAMNKYVERLDGREQTAMAAYTDTYLHEDGRWRCIQAQITPVAAENWPSDHTIVSVYLDGVLQPARRA